MIHMNWRVTNNLFPWNVITNLMFTDFKIVFTRFSLSYSETYYDSNIIYMMHIISQYEIYFMIQLISHNVCNINWSQSCIFQSNFINISIVLFNLFASTVSQRLKTCQGHLRSNRNSIRALEVIQGQKMIKCWNHGLTVAQRLTLHSFCKINIL